MANELRDAVEQADWAAFDEAGKTMGRVEKSWVASEERCELLRRLVEKYNAKRILEVGACCGLASLSMAEVLPEGGEVVALEIDPFLAAFGQTFLDTCDAGKKVKFMIGPAMDSLKSIAQECFNGTMEPFDFLMIDADRAGMENYFNMFWWESPNMLGEHATVCIDITPYKGQRPVLTSMPSSGDLQGDLWVVPSGQEQIESVRRTLEASADHSVYIVAGLLVSHARDKGEGASSSGMSTPRPASMGGFHPRKRSGMSSVSTSPSLTHGANPLAAFPNEHLKAMCGARWVPPQPSDPVADLRRKVREADWDQYFRDGKTLTRVDRAWLGSEARAAVLCKLAEDKGARNILEIGSFCGATSLVLAEKLPAGGKLLALEADPFLVEFGQRFREKSAAGKKIATMLGPAADSLAELATRAKEDAFKPFDFVVIDADRAGMCDYFQAIYDSPHLLAADAIVCIDIALYKGQNPVLLGRSQHKTQWVMPSGQDKVDELREMIAESSRFSFYTVSQLLVVKATGMEDITM